MNLVYKASDPLDEFYRICDEQGEERRLEARRKIYEEKDFNCVYCLYHEKRSGCLYRECPLIPDRVCCGCATIASAWRYMVDITVASAADRRRRSLPSNRQQKKTKV